MTKTDPPEGDDDKAEGGEDSLGEAHGKGCSVGAAYIVVENGRELNEVPAAEVICVVEVSAGDGSELAEVALAQSGKPEVGREGET